MVQDIAVLHRDKSKPDVGRVPLCDRRWVRWETCLRHVYFGHRREVEKRLPRHKALGDIYTGEKAYSFCLKTVCGLNSPLLGETEVFGQFKALFKEFDYHSHGAGAVLKPFVQSIFSDAKAVRHRHLTGLGSQSYGSLARKLLKDFEEINILGAGLLVKDMLPWLVKSAPRVRIFSRRREPAEQRVRELKQSVAIDLCDLQDLSQVGGALIVAAPISSDWLMDQKLGPSLKKIIDLRDNSAKDPLHVGAEVIPLSCFFAEIEANKTQLQTRVQRAEQEIQKRAKERCNRIQIRPYGWDDLCG